ncbi:hypothetical protein llap_5985 [Limosa lapponica baueri]|uniref:Uncharacterized protein n=1 Tax=Limosa lapponica baueri TaxID=1758121 RepID=A0A2I0UCD5_LIMLA|nr:hypothetical protein llap_5985 [Limosa lapponica baueri]
MLFFISLAVMKLLDENFYAVDLQGNCGKFGVIDESRHPLAILVFAVTSSQTGPYRITMSVRLIQKLLDDKCKKMDQFKTPVAVHLGSVEDYTIPEQVPLDPR